MKHKVEVEEPGEPGLETWWYSDDGPLYYIKVMVEPEEGGEPVPYFMTGVPSSRLVAWSNVPAAFTVEVDFNLSEDPRDGVLTEDDAHLMLMHIKRVTEPPPGLDVRAVNIRALLLGPTKSGRVGMKLREIKVMRAVRTVTWKEHELDEGVPPHQIRGVVNPETN